MPRPSVDVVVPFRGSAVALGRLCERLDGLKLGPSDTLVVVDNTPGRPPPSAVGAVRVIRAIEVLTPGYARNRGVALGSAEWLAFLDADVSAPSDLLDRLFEPVPAPDTGLLAGGVYDEPVPAGGPPAARYAYLRGMMLQEDTLRFGEWGYPKSANIACRRAAFEAAGGFREHLRAAEDADLTFRLRTAGWALERREDAAVVHRSRQTVGQLCVQRLCHGSGGAWLDGEYPGSFPPRRLPGLLWWGLRRAVSEGVAAVRRRDRDRALFALLEPLELITHELGRSLPNERPLTAGSVWDHLRAMPARHKAPRLEYPPPSLGRVR